MGHRCWCVQSCRLPEGDGCPDGLYACKTQLWLVGVWEAWLPLAVSWSATSTRRAHSLMHGECCILTMA